MSELLPCPFCGGVTTINSGPSVSVDCCNDECPSNRCYSSQAEAIAAWNTRAPSPTAAEIIKLAEAWVDQAEYFTGLARDAASALPDTLHQRALADACQDAQTHKEAAESAFRRAALSALTQEK